MGEADPARVGGILLAAGGSARLGRPKQLVEFDGATLIRRAANVLDASGCDPKVVVLGANAEECRNELCAFNIDICTNDDWASGMSSSIKAGLGRLLEIDPGIDAVIITLCDQPYITTNIIDNFIAEYRRIRPLVVASEYNGIAGVPALFSRQMFDGLLAVEGDRGASSLIRSAGDRAVKLKVPEAAFDIDSPEDLLSVKTIR